MSSESRAKNVLPDQGISLDEVLSAIDEEKLTPIVRSALEDTTIEIDNWSHKTVLDLPRRKVIQITGTASGHGDSLPWSLFLKVYGREESSGSPTASETPWNHEAAIYQAGLLDDMNGGLKAPKCYQIETLSVDRVWMWFEDVSEDTDISWDLGRYNLAARHLGEFNGLYLTQRPLPSQSWLPREFERMAVARDSPGIDELRQSLNHPIVCQVFPMPISSSMFRLWDRRELLLVNIYDRLPQTFGHLDPGRHNLFSRRNSVGVDETVAIDWELAGIGALGEELVRLVTNSLFFRLFPIDKAQELDEVAFTGYIDGLRDAGWQGDPRQVRYGYVAVSITRALRLARLVRVFQDEDRYHAWLGKKVKGSFEEMVASCRKLMEFLLAMEDEIDELERVLF